MNSLFGPALGSQLVEDVIGDRAWLRAMCRAEQALAAACAEAGLIDEPVSRVIGHACAEVSELDPAGLGAAAVPDGNPVPALVDRLRAAAASQPSPVAAEAANAIHLGATGQDIMDTAAMLVSADALALIGAELSRAAELTAGLAASHRDTPMIARILLQQALPTTFGAVAVNWTAGLDWAAHRLAALRHGGLAVQLGGMAGTLASLHPHGPAVRAAMARQLELADPGRDWHAERSRILELGAALAIAAATAGKVATDLVLLAQTEVGELSEAAGGGPSAMPNKRKPVAAVTARAAAAQAPGLLSTLLSAAAGHEHQRAAGGWHAEWLPLIGLFQSAGGAAQRLTVALDGLLVHAEVMRANLDSSGGRLLAERVADELSERLGRPRAQQLVREALADPGGFRPALAAAGIDDPELDRLLDPAGYLGQAGDDVDNYLAGPR